MIGHTEYISTRQECFEIDGIKITASVWFPSKQGSKILSYQQIFTANAYADGEIFGDKFPLVMIAHGSGGNDYSFSYLAESLANSGYFVVSIKYEDNHEKQTMWRRFYSYPERVKMLFEAIKLDPAYAPHINFDQCGLIGFSIGGYAGVVNSGGVPDFSEVDELKEVHDELKKVDYGTFKINELKALVLLDPAISVAFSNQLNNLCLPAALYYSEIKDAYTMGQPERYKNLFINLQVKQKLLGVGHYIYINQAPRILQKISPIKCSDYRGRRSASHQEIISGIDRFFDPLINYIVKQESELGAVK